MYFLYHGYLVNSKEIGLQRQFNSQEEQIIDELNHLLVLTGAVRNLQYQEMAISDYAISDGQWLGVRPKDRLQVAVFNRAGAAINVCTLGILSSSCLAIFDRWKQLAGYDPVDEKDFNLARWLATQRLS